MPYRIFSFLITLFFLVIIGCSSTSKKTDISISHYATKLEIYAQALASKNCEQFKNLSEDKSFILASPAKIRSIEFCNPSDLKADLEQELSSVNEPWLRKMKRSVLSAKAPFEATEEKIDFENLTPDKILPAAQKLQRAREFQQARNLYRKIIHSTGYKYPDDIIQSAFKGLRSAYKLDQRKGDHIRVAGEYARWTAKRKNLIDFQEAHVFWARAAWTAGDAVEATRILKMAEKRLKSRKSFSTIDEIYFVMGKIHEEKEEFTQAIERFAVGETYSKKSSPYFERLVWSKAWLSYKLGNYEQAAQQFAGLLESTKPGFDYNKYLFWQGISFKKNNQPELASQNFENLRKIDPFGYYGMLAHREEDVPFEPLGKIDESKRSGRPMSIPMTTHQLIKSLSFVGEKNLLQEVVTLQLSELFSKNETDPEIWLYYFQNLHSEKLYSVLFSEVAKLDYNLRMDVMRKHPSLIFPQEFRELAVINSNRAGVNPEMVMAIMRQESSFNPQARSPADAMGLMQVIPPVAESHREVAGVNFESHLDLLKPEINIPIGVAVLSGLKKKYDGQFVLMAASYNAADRAIQNWLDTRLKEDPLEFIEDIPYEETRGYVKIVLRNFIAYSRISQSENRFVFPKWCLENLHSFKSSTQ